MINAGFDIKEGIHPIVPIILYDARVAQEMSRRLLEKDIYVIGFFYPVVPKHKATISVQISASHSLDDLDRSIISFIEVAKELKVI